MRIIGFVFGVLLTGSLVAQPANMDRMNRDLKVAEQIITSLLSDLKVESQSIVLGFSTKNSMIEGSYLEGFGILFSMSSRSIPSHIGFP